jgi:hypothetical protein
MGFIDMCGVVLLFLFYKRKKKKVKKLFLVRRVTAGDKLR